MAVAGGAVVTVGVGDEASDFAPGAAVTGRVTAFAGVGAGSSGLGGVPFSFAEGFASGRDICRSGAAGLGGAGMGLAALTGGEVSLVEEGGAGGALAGVDETVADLEGRAGAGFEEAAGAGLGATGDGAFHGTKFLAALGAGVEAGTEAAVGFFTIEVGAEEAGLAGAFAASAPRLGVT